MFPFQGQNIQSRGPPTRCSDGSPDMGRIGPLTLAVALARRAEQARVRHPEGKFLIG